jgi:predicted CoA-binding protein
MMHATPEPKPTPTPAAELHAPDPEAIEAFLHARRVALVGVSHDPKDFTRALWTELRARGMDVVPVNPNLTDVDGVPAFADITEVTPPVEAAYVATPAQAALPVVKACGVAGVTTVWLHKGGGPGALDPAAVAFGRARGLRVVAGQCLFMFLEHPHWIHRIHRFIHGVPGRRSRPTPLRRAALIGRLAGELPS